MGLRAVIYSQISGMGYSRRSADFQICCFAGFQSCVPWLGQAVFMSSTRAISSPDFVTHPIDL